MFKGTGDELLKLMMVNPFYCINFSEVNATLHDPVVTKEMWMETNKILIDEIGIDEWLKCLLEAMENPVTSDELKEPVQ